MAFADAVISRFEKGKDDAPADDADASDEPAPKKGEKGRMLAAAIKRGDGDAIEEAILAICG